MTDGVKALVRFHDTEMCTCVCVCSYLAFRKGNSMS